ncbi:MULTISPECIES: ammonia monooxygenase [unclassified Salmonella]|uniref:ammonia monooxygenase n=1 Tax=unclassified Salmonella TaxID=2614656 RepID=UPI001277D2A2|nr:ammonia monooxygenase [Salmonella sp. 32020501-2019-00050]EBB6210407.1 ammonia monooxygenase [Salmonella enterica]ECH8734652.1 ammonia monooxygenase [Salmonella enterica subsp. enterica serovar Wandsworth]EDN8388589.1 ammonia monooxygenase [Salmonella enterica subsp. enterica serovar Wandsworth]EDS5037868.1 ammonia monooxygenase [Salmonella enterica subsp. enterica serovar Wandsworth]EDT6630341.1 ammonia monooxygenase [Salmonella enterica subsp. enterica serovar Wandsworth]
MNTQNVRVKTATKESSERWGANPKARLACVIAEQRSYLAELCQVWNLQLSQKDEAEEVMRLLSLMSDNVHKEGVLCWERSYPLVSFQVVQPWLQAKAHAIRLYGVIGREAWDIARNDLRNNIRFAQAMLETEVC